MIPACDGRLDGQTVGRVATRPVFAGTSRFSACLSRVPVEGLPGCYVSRFWSISNSNNSNSSDNF